MLNRISYYQWVRDNGDNTHNLNYNLDENSIVMDLGGYTGVWAQQIVDRYNPNIYIIEPIPQFYDQIVDKFKNNTKVSVLNIGSSYENKEGSLYLNGDGTSSELISGEEVKVVFNDMKTILNKWGLETVDLIQINIEGDEYSLLENMIKTNIINKFKNIQIQFHLGIEDCVNRRNNIHNSLIYNGFKKKFDYPFVWESWTKLI